MTLEELQRHFLEVINKESSRSIKLINEQYNLAFKSMDEELLKIYSNIFAGVAKEDYYNEILKYNRLQNLENQIASSLSQATQYQYTTTRQNGEMAIANNFYYQQYATNWVKPTAFTLIPEKVVQYSVTGRKDIIKTIKNELLKQQLTYITPRHGMTLKEIINKNANDQLRAVFNAVTQGIIRGDGVKTVSKELQTIKKFTNYQAERIVRTETHRNASAGEFLQWQTAKAKGVDGARVLVATKDVRTRQQSAIVDGRRDEGEGFLYPNQERYFVPGNTGKPAWDINDREYVIYDIDGTLPTVERARNPVTGKNEIIKATSFDDWAKGNGLSYNKNGKLVKTGGASTAGVSKVLNNPMPKPQKNIADILIQNEESMFKKSKKTGYEYAVLMDGNTGEVLIDNITSKSKNKIFLGGAVREKLKGNILTHTHPSNGSFSIDDILSLEKSKAKSYRVRGFDGAQYEASIDFDDKLFLNMMTRTNGSGFEKMINRYNEITRKSVLEQVALGNLGLEEANYNYWHYLWENISKNVNYFNYKRVKK